MKMNILQHGTWFHGFQEGLTNSQTFVSQRSSQLVSVTESFKNKKNTRPAAGIHGFRNRCYWLAHKNFMHLNNQNLEGMHNYTLSKV